MLKETEETDCGFAFFVTFVFETKLSQMIWHNSEDQTKSSCGTPSQQCCTFVNALTFICNLILSAHTASEM